MHHLTIDREHGGVGQPLFDELQAEEAVIDAGEGWSRALNHIDLGPVARQAIQQRTNQHVGLLAW